MNKVYFEGLRKLIVSKSDVSYEKLEEQAELLPKDTRNWPSYLSLILYDDLITQLQNKITSNAYILPRPHHILIKITQLHSIKLFRGQILISFRVIKKITKDKVGSIRTSQSGAGTFTFHEAPEEKLPIYDDEEYIPYTDQPYPQGIINTRIIISHTIIR